MVDRSLRALLATLVCVATPAHASCPAANQYSYSWANAATATLNYATVYNYTGTTSGGASQNFTVGFTTNGLTSTVVGGFQMPNISNMITDGVATNNLAVGGIFSARTTSITSGVRTIATTFTFATPIRDFSVQVNDIDFASNQYRDWFYIRGNNGATAYVPTLTTTFGNNNSAAGPKTATNSTLQFGAGTPAFGTTALSANEAVGTSASGNNANNGTITASFAQPVLTVTLIYGNYPYSSGENTTGQQAYGIQQVSWCPMPSVTVAKSSAPWSDPRNGTTNPKMIPGADVIYSLTVSNSNSSPVDASTLNLTDVLPTGLTFYNGDIDDAGPLTTNFQFVDSGSGVTMAPANITYSNNGGTTYAYTPAAGYDAAVTALKFTPTGSLAAGGSFTIKFRARIN